MRLSDIERSVVERLFLAMQAGSDGEDDMMDLFAPDAVFIEPFSGQPVTHRGTKAIRKSFQAQWQEPHPDMNLAMNRVEIDGEQVRADWTCTSPAFPTPMKGHDLFTIRNGRIVRLEVLVTELPPMGP